jgi:Ca-activated chloride channel homolog
LYDKSFEKAGITKITNTIAYFTVYFLLAIIIQKRSYILNNFEFEYPYFFILLLFIICIYKCPVTIKKIIFPHTHIFTKITNFINKEKLLYSLIFALLVTSLASPINYDAKLSQERKGRDLVFVLDTSGSMRESGYSNEHQNRSKFDILKNIISEFIHKRYDDNVGVTLFGSFAFSSVPLTYDMNAVSFLLDFLDVGIAGENTAIGDGIVAATKLLEYDKAKNKVMILITDGYQNSGNISIKDAIHNAKKLHIKIYTIGIGKKSDFDEKLLQKIAKDTDAKMFVAEDESKLIDVYNTLNSLEPSPIRSQQYLNKYMLFSFPLSLAMLLLLYILSRRTIK